MARAVPALCWRSGCSSLREIKSCAGGVLAPSTCMFSTLALAPLSLMLPSPPAGQRMAPPRAAASAPAAPYSADQTQDGDYTLISTSLLSQLLGVEQAACTTPQLPTPLKNRYIALRHGQSESNVEGVISSDPAVGTERHGLTTEGRLQARRAATRLLDAVGRESLDTLVFVSSDFTRAWQTAEEALDAVKNVLQYEQAICVTDPSRSEEECALLAELPPSLAAGVRRTPLLRERWFGELDATPLLNYNKVWPRDLVSAAHDHCGVESVDGVTARVRELVLSLEGEFDGRTIVLASHADTLQIAQCYVAAADPRTFSMFRFKNGEVRELHRTPDSLPAPVPLTYL